MQYLDVRFERRSFPMFGKPLTKPLTPVKQQYQKQSPGELKPQSQELSPDEQQPQKSPSAGQFPTIIEISSGEDLPEIPIVSRKKSKFKYYYIDYHNSELIFGHKRRI